MEKEYINNEDTDQEPLHLEEPDVAYHPVDESVDTFEEDWEKCHYRRRISKTGP